MAHDHAALGGSEGNGPDYKKFGLVKITLSYHYDDKQWEVELDPHEVSWTELKRGHAPAPRRAQAMSAALFCQVGR